MGKTCHPLLIHVLRLQDIRRAAKFSVGVPTFKRKHHSHFGSNLHNLLVSRNASFEELPRQREVKLASLNKKSCHG